MNLKTLKKLCKIKKGEVQLTNTAKITVFSDRFFDDQIFSAFFLTVKEMKRNREK
jgi:hypothetical protein